MLSTPSSGIAADPSRYAPVQPCPACGRPMDRRVFFPRVRPDELRCRDSACYASPFFRGRQQVGEGAQGQGVDVVHAKNFSAFESLNATQQAWERL